MRHWRWIVVALAVIAMAVLVYPLVQTQKRLRLVQSELGRANEQVVQAKAGAAELERVIANLKIELDAANLERTQLQDSLREVNSDVLAPVASVKFAIKMTSPGPETPQTRNVLPHPMVRVICG